jgi:hydroxymethylpyrimidine/phosphomethylpyrimidine kinase / thiaminase
MYVFSPLLTLAWRSSILLIVEHAINAATLYTHHAIAAARKIGRGFGPLEHLHSIRSPFTPPRSLSPASSVTLAPQTPAPSMIPPRTAANPYPFTHYLILSTLPAWKAYVEHDFVKQLGKGILPKEKFVHFIKYVDALSIGFHNDQTDRRHVSINRQDYHYLKYYARSYALLAAKASTFESIHAATNIILSVINEIATHKIFCATFGVTPQELEECEEEVACTAYGAYILNVGLQGDTAKLTMALMACLLGYGEVGLWLKRHAIRSGEESGEERWVVMDGNPYKKWIEDYTGEAYQGAVKAGLGMLIAR